ncbi:LysR family transcriptional regulator [Enterococcus cecorum]|uniref:LysR family transcriptional regulator n=1 Tax=Enterococcus cecorum TaxID=44008 RepID=A0AAW8TQZ0_9ENTE|nr:LysR family transcriptional regulator [Enterococcus cecorum]HJD15254.1 LysR family transcriptional regulator [Candidatus Enterococcus stercoripullorum]MBM6935494.1 LysR family transcriptional regulator [Enterococcus cecorum]MCJ0544122.1 LysR family transcriptional regulator [Enterococcus cecorum]MCJ0548648.1 LysR family transcriptional regulator [Enterococcus cecorum]MCJ0553733.1 LysR family transcriptional regulator [Enterococcus cecorum]
MFQLLRTFISVYETHNFTRSADSLFLSQPTVSAQIKKLEEMLTVPLFIRNGKQEILPTAEADYMYPKILKILNEWDHSVKKVSQQKNLRETCVIASSHFCAVYYLPKLVSHLLTAFPRVDFVFKVSTSDEIAEWLENSKIDIGLIEQVDHHKEFNKTTLAMDELVLAGDLSSEYWLLGNDDLSLRQLNQHYLQNHPIEPKIIEIDTDEMIGSMLKNGVGQSIVPRCTLDPSIHFSQLPKDNKRHFYSIVRKDNLRENIVAINQKLQLLAEKLF